MIEVGYSRIHGRGVFASRSITAGERIIEYTGEILTDKEVAARFDEAAIEDPHTYLFHVDEDQWVDATVAGNEARFINHSCAPNCEVEIEEGRILIVALRDIPMGEELSYDYALEIEEDPSPGRLEQFTCRCRTRDCRGTMLERG